MIRKLTSFLVILTISLPVMNLFAGDDSTDDAQFVEKRALLFQISNNFTLKSFQGSVISYQKWVSDNKSIRWGISLSGNVSKNEGNSEEIDYSSYRDTIEIVSKYSVNEDNYYIYASLHRLTLHRLEEKNDIRGYWGFGPEIGINHSKSFNVSLPTDDDTSSIELKNNRELNSIYIGFNGLMGVEWTVKKNMTLCAEYSVLMKVGYSDSFIERNYGNKWPGYYRYDFFTESTDGYYFGFNPTVRFGLAVFF